MSFLLDGLQSDWITTSFPIIRIVLFCIIVLCCIVITISVLMQSNNKESGMGAINGSQESYYNENKGSSKDGKLKKLTIIMSSIIAVCALLYFISLIINNPA